MHIPASQFMAYSLKNTCEIVLSVLGCAARCAWCVIPPLSLIWQLGVLRFYNPHSTQQQNWAAIHKLHGAFPFWSAFNDKIELQFTKCMVHSLSDPHSTTKLSCNSQIAWCIPFLIRIERQNRAAIHKMHGAFPFWSASNDKIELQFTKCIVHSLSDPHSTTKLSCNSQIAWCIPFPQILHTR